ncbi:MAG: hypothetical protein ACREMR_08225 [Gemmatimonadales bacterium]
MSNTRSDTVSNTYYGGGSGCYNCWDGSSAAAGFVAGAVVAGAAAAASTPPPSTTVVVAGAPAAAPAPPPVAPPCNIAPVPSNGVPYYKCGAAWYAPGYGSTGVVYVPVAPPPGY